MFRRSKELLEWINSERAKRECEPLTEIPKGHRGVPGACPIAAALSCGTIYARVLADEFYYQRENGFDTDHFSLPDVARLFVDEFDHGYYPEYDVEK